MILTADMDFVKRMMIHEFNSYGKVDLLLFSFSFSFPPRLHSLFQHMPTYKPFLPILGKGLVTSHGPLWKRQRRIIGVGFVGDVLDIAMECGFTAGLLFYLVLVIFLVGGWSRYFGLSIIISFLIILSRQK